MKTPVLAILAVIALTAPATAQTSIACGAKPPAWAQHEPNVPYRIYYDSPATIVHDCHKLEKGMAAPLLGCAYLNDNTNTGTALIIISSDLSDTDRACVRQYEFAHLPPNNFVDPVMEAGAPDDPVLIGKHPTPWTGLRTSAQDAIIGTTKDGLPIYKLPSSGQ